MADKRSTLDDIPVGSMFVASEVLPDAADAFLSQTPSVRTVLEQADVVLDANSLLLPYLAESESLKRISEVYRSLVKVIEFLYPRRPYVSLLKTGQQTRRNPAESLG